MPGFYTYGVHAYLQLCDSASGSSTGSVVAESPPTSKWRPTEGMTHPILETTVVSPAKAYPQSPIPFRIIIDFSPETRSPSRASPPDTGPDPLKGDVRIELKIDGVVRGWRVLPQTKIWPKGARIKFSGSRVGRTEERAFVFTELPLGIDAGAQPIHVHSLPSPPASAPATPNSLSLLGHEDPALIPHAPSGLPPNTSHIQILITLGKKHSTLEKYLIFSPLLQEAFYIPPRLTSSSYKCPDGGMPNAARGGKRKAVASPRAKKKEVKIGPFEASPSVMMESEQSNETTEGVNADMGEATGWRPVGLARTSQKTAQMREAEFTARIHLARFWFFVVPDPSFQPQTSISSLDNQPNYGDDVLGKGNAKVQMRTNRQSQIKLEGSDAAERKSEIEAFGDVGDNRTSGFSFENLQAGSERQTFQTRYGTARGHYLKVVDQISPLSFQPGTTENVRYFMKSASDLMGSENVDKSRWKSNNGEDIQGAQ